MSFAGTGNTCRSYVTDFRPDAHVSCQVLGLCVCFIVYVVCFNVCNVGLLCKVNVLYMVIDRHDVSDNISSLY